MVLSTSFSWSSMLEGGTAMPLVPPSNNALGPFLRGGPSRHNSQAQAIPQAATLVAAVNAGSSDNVTASDGVVFVADTQLPFLQEADLARRHTCSTFKDIAATEDGALYQTEVWQPGGFVYEIPLKDDNDDDELDSDTFFLYQVELYWAETYPETSHVGGRVFDVLMENVLVLENFDIVDRVGADTALVTTLLVGTTFVADGSLTISTRARQENPKLNALRIWKVPETFLAVPREETEPPPFPASVDSPPLVTEISVQPPPFANDPLEVVVEITDDHCLNMSSAPLKETDVYFFSTHMEIQVMDFVVLPPAAAVESTTTTTRAMWKIYPSTDQPWAVDAVIAVVVAGAVFDEAGHGSFPKSMSFVTNFDKNQPLRPTTRTPGLPTPSAAPPRPQSETPIDTVDAPPTVTEIAFQSPRFANDPMEVIVEISDDRGLDSLSTPLEKRDVYFFSTHMDIHVMDFVVLSSGPTTTTRAMWKISPSTPQQPWTIDAVTVVVVAGAVVDDAGQPSLTKSMSFVTQFENGQPLRPPPPAAPIAHAAATTTTSAASAVGTSLAPALAQEEEEERAPNEDDEDSAPVVSEILVQSPEFANDPLEVTVEITDNRGFNTSSIPLEENDVFFFSTHMDIQVMEFQSLDAAQPATTTTTRALWKIYPATDQPWAIDAVTVVVVAGAVVNDAGQPSISQSRSFTTHFENGQPLRPTPAPVAPHWLSGSNVPPPLRTDLSFRLPKYANDPLQVTLEITAQGGFLNVTSIPLQENQVFFFSTHMEIQVMDFVVLSSTTTTARAMWKIYPSTEEPWAIDAVVAVVVAGAVFDEAGHASLPQSISIVTNFTNGQPLRPTTSSLP